MQKYSEQEIRNIVAEVLKKTVQGSGAGNGREPADCAQDGMEVPVEVSARHVHVTAEALEILFGKGYQLKPKRMLSQPGQFLSEEKVKLVTPKGQIDKVSILGPVRNAVQVELSNTDARTLGIAAPLRLSGDLKGAGDVLLVGPAGSLEAKGSAIVAKAHVHMTPDDAARYGVKDGQNTALFLNTDRPVTLQNVVVRVSEQAALAVHIDFDEANAAGYAGPGTGVLLRQAGSPCPRQEALPAAEPARKTGKKTLITEAEAIRMTQGGGPVRIPDGAILTPSAKDVFRSKGLI